MNDSVSAIKHQNMEEISSEKFPDLVYSLSLVWCFHFIFGCKFPKRLKDFPPEFLVYFWARILAELSELYEAPHHTIIGPKFGGGG